MIIIGDTDDDDDDDDDERDEDDDDEDDEEDDEDEEDGDDDDVTDVTSSSSSSVDGKERGDSGWGKEELPLTEDLTKKTVQVCRPFISLTGPALLLRSVCDILLAYYSNLHCWVPTTSLSKLEIGTALARIPGA